MTCGENSMALVGFLLEPSVSAKSTSSAEPAILNSLTARNAGLWPVKPLTDTVRGRPSYKNPEKWPKNLSGISPKMF